MITSSVILFSFNNLAWYQKLLLCRNVKFAQQKLDKKYASYAESVGSFYEISKVRY